jgi:hypothetical protein
LWLPLLCLAFALFCLVPAIILLCVFICVLL